MSRYTVVYLAEAENDLVAIWEEAADRRPVSKAADTADQLLSSSPQRHSVDLGEGLWRLELLPLRFYFAVREKDRVVEVGNVIRVTKEA